MPPLLVAIVGPTACGKTDLSLALAESFGGEVVNYDSVQLFRGFDIGSAKIRPTEMRGVPHHLIDVLEPTAAFSAGDYGRLARTAAHDIAERGAVPIFTGGTGFYLRATLDGLFAGPRRDAALRARLEARAGERGPEHVHRILRRLDTGAAQRIHPNDTPKVIRAIEVCLRGEAPMEEQWSKHGASLQGFRVCRMGLDPPRDVLRARIAERSRRMFAEGLVDEVGALLGSGVPREAWPFRAIGYAQALRVHEGSLTAGAAAEEITLRTGQYAKRQMTWFRREPDVHWIRGLGSDREVQQAAIAAIRDRAD